MKDITISRRSLLVSAGLLALAPLAGCGGNSGSGSAAAGSDYTIGVLQLTEHSALDAANDGFVKAIKESGLKVKIDQKNAQNDQSTCKSIADKFVGDGVDLIYAIATPAAQAAAGTTAEQVGKAEALIPLAAERCPIEQLLQGAGVQFSISGTVSVSRLALSIRHSAGDILASLLK